MKWTKLERFLQRDYPEFYDIFQTHPHRCVVFFEHEMKTRYYVNTLEHYGSGRGTLSRYVLRTYARIIITEHTEYTRFKLLL